MLPNILKALQKAGELINTSAAKKAASTLLSLAMVSLNFCSMTMVTPKLRSMALVSLKLFSKRI